MATFAVTRSVILGRSLSEYQTVCRLEANASFIACGAERIEVQGKREHLAMGEQL